MVTNEGAWIWYKVKRKKNGLTVKAFQTGGLAADLEKKEQNFFFFLQQIRNKPCTESLMNTQCQHGAQAQCSAEYNHADLISLQLQNPALGFTFYVLTHIFFLLTA